MHWLNVCLTLLIWLHIWVYWWMFSKRNLFKSLIFCCINLSDHCWIWIIQMETAGPINVNISTGSFSAAKTNVLLLPLLNFPNDWVGKSCTELALHVSFYLLGERFVRRWHKQKIKQNNICYSISIIHRRLQTNYG